MICNDLTVITKLQKSPCNTYEQLVTLVTRGLAGKLYPQDFALVKLDNTLQLVTRSNAGGLKYEHINQRHKTHENLQVFKAQEVIE